MEDQSQETASSQNTQGPKPLSQEGPVTQMEIDVKPKPVDKITTVHWKKKDFIKDIINTPKETGSADPISEPSSSGASKPPKPPGEDNTSILQRLDGDGASSGSDKKSDPPTPEESKDTAGMIIDGFNALFLFFIQIWSKDTDTKDYEVETEEKKKLKHYLSAIFFRAEKKINPIWLFIGLLLVMYIPILRKGHNHRKMVLEQRAKNRPGATIIDGPRKRQRKTKFSDGDDGYTPHVEIR